MPYADPEKRNERQRQRYHEDPEFRLKHYLSQRKYLGSDKGKLCRSKSIKKCGRSRVCTRETSTEHRHLLYEALVALRGDSCGICGTTVAMEVACVDHIIAIVDGGSKSLSNVQLAHRKCNLDKERKSAFERTMKKLTKSLTQD